MTVLVLGGTAEGRAVADGLTARGIDVTTSLAGRVTNPRWPETGGRRLGGFGGVAGMTAWLADHGVDVVVDATHPFAEVITAHASQACATQGIALVRLVRPSWADDPRATNWTWVGSHKEAADVAARAEATTVLTVGRQHLSDYLPALADQPVIARVVEEPDLAVPASWRIVRSRGPYSLATELDLLAGAHTLVTKDSGGDHTHAKLDAAAELGVHVVILRRAAEPSNAHLVTTPNEACAAVVDLSSRQ